MNEYNIKNIRKQFKEQGVFYTTKELALYLKSFLPDDVKEIYDPTCGNGGLLSVFDDEAEKYGQDINGEQVEAAKENLKNFHGAVGDTLAEPAFKDKKFKYIIANPPFSIKWEQLKDERFSVAPALAPKSKADYAFLLHILYYLTDDGTAVVLNFPGILYRGNAEGKIRKWLIEQNYIDTVVAVDGGFFVDTKIATCILILKKQKNTTEIRFAHKDKEIIVPVEEVANNGYNLSVNLYLTEEKKKETEDISIEDLSDDVKRKFIENMINQLKFEELLCDLKGTSIDEFIEDIRRALEEFKNDKREQT